MADASSCPGDALAILGRADALSLAVDGAVGPDDGGVGSHAAGGDTEEVAGVFKGNFRGWRVDRNDPSDEALACGFADEFSEHVRFSLLARFALHGPGETAIVRAEVVMDEA